MAIILMAALMPAAPEPSASQSADEITFTATGDIAMSSSYPEFRLPPDEGKSLFSRAKSYMTGDLIIGNCEGTFTTLKNPIKRINSKTTFAFRMPPDYAGLLKDAGFNIMTIANNHAFDFGRVGLNDTIAALDKYGIKNIGQRGRALIETVNGIKVGLIGFACYPTFNSILERSHYEIMVREIKKQVDLVVVIFHGGAEGSGAMHVPKKTEFLAGENRGDVYAFAHNVVDAGADIVIGHSPHVLRACELYKGKFISYSLGNFCGYSSFSLFYPGNISGILSVTVAKDGTFIRAKMVPMILVDKGSPMYDKDLNALKILNKLAQEDFPSTGVTFRDDGTAITSPSIDGHRISHSY